VLLAYSQIWPHMGYGPFEVLYQKQFDRCDNSWWSALTYTMNMYPFNLSDNCMGWSWYLGDDMVFFIVAICILPIYHKRRWLGWLILLGLCGVSFAITIILVLKNNLGIYVFGQKFADYQYYGYSRSYTRIPAYFVGVAAAWVLDDWSEKASLARLVP